MEILKRYWSICVIMLLVMALAEAYTVRYLSNKKAEEVSINFIQALSNKNSEIEILKKQVSALTESNENIKEHLNVLNEQLDKAKAEIEEFYKYKATKLQTIYDNMMFKDMDIALDVVRVSLKYGVDPLLIAALINTESGFKKNVVHKLPYVKGFGGINTRYWKMKLDTYKDQVEATVIVYKRLLELSNGDMLKALHLYKGKSNLGLRRAKYVVALYNNYREKVRSVKVGEEIYAFLSERSKFY